MKPAAGFVVPVRHGSGRALFLVHSVAGELTWLPYLLEGLDPRCALYGFAAPGLHTEAPFFPTLEAMAAAYLRDMRKQQPHGPYLIGGYSMGGVVAFEMARQLAASGEDTGLLVLIDAYAPHPQRGAPVAAWSRNGLLMQVIANQLALQWQADTLLPAQAFEGVPYTEHSAVAARHLLAHARTRHSYGTLQPYLRRCQTLMRVHAELLTNYRPQPPLHCPGATMLFRAGRGLIGQDSALRLPVLPQAQRAPAHGWEALLARLDTVDIDEEHFLLGGRAAMQRIAAAVDARLASVACD